MADSSLGTSRPLTDPLYLTSVFTLPDLDALDGISNGTAPGFIYARDNHPNAASLGQELAELEGAAWALVCGSGMAALTLALLSRVSAGDRVVASNRLYGRTAALLRQELSRFGVTTTFVDTSDLQQVHDALSEPARLLVVETISNPLLRVADLPALADAAHRCGTALLVDNTFATPALCRPLALGADLVMESLTKMIGGHSDLTLGVVCGTDAAAAAAIRQTRSIWGLSSGPFDCWLAARGLATLELRMNRATENAAWLAEWLAHQPVVKRVIYPGQADHPDYELARRMLPRGAGNMLCFELEGNGRDAANRFFRQASRVPFSPSLGGVGTTASHPATTSHRYESSEERERQGITDGFIRLSVGIEPIEAIEQALAEGLAGSK